MPSWRINLILFSSGKLRLPLQAHVNRANVVIGALRTMKSPGRLPLHYPVFGSWLKCLHAHSTHATVEWGNNSRRRVRRMELAGSLEPQAIRIVEAMIDLR
jgi:hypothetical protein